MVERLATAEVEHNSYQKEVESHAKELKRELRETKESCCVAIKSLAD